MTLGIGRRRGIQQCSSNGTFAVLALDHRQNLRRALRPEAPQSVTYEEFVALKRDIVRSLRDTASAFVLDPEYGAAQCIMDGSLPGDRGLIVSVEASGYTGDSMARSSAVLEGWSVEKSKRIGASAVKLIVYYHPDAPNTSEQEALVAAVEEDCRIHDMAFFLEPLTYSPDSGQPTLAGEQRREAVLETARRLTPIGGDVLKVEFPYDPGVTDEKRWADACQELTEASVTPWVLLSGGVDSETFERQLAVACAAGASGMVAGRAIWSEATRLSGEQRREFLETTARERLARLAAVASASPRATPGPRSTDPGEHWYLDY